MDYVVHVATLFAIFSILALSLQLVVGYTGIVSLTHAAFYGIGAYAVAILTTVFGINFFLALAVGVLCACVAALVNGYVFTRFSGDYYALASMGFNVVVFSIFLNWHSVTRGPLGISGIDRPSVFGFQLLQSEYFFIFTCVIVALLYVVIRRVVGGSFGRALKAIREDEGALAVLGYRTFDFKLTVFVASAGVAAIAGGLYAVYAAYIDPSSFTLSESIFLLAIVILGGLGSLRGAVLGTAVLILLPEALRFIGLPTDVAAQVRQILYGIVLVWLMLYRPQGLVGEYKL